MDRHKGAVGPRRGHALTQYGFGSGAAKEGGIKIKKTRQVRNLPGLSGLVPGGGDATGAVACLCQVQWRCRLLRSALGKATAKFGSERR